MTHSSPIKQSPGLLVLLASLVALGPLTIDMYLPALPGMVDDFATDNARVQLTISSFLLGFALFHLVCGPLADRYGRKPVLIGGVALFIAASFACAQAATINELIMWRFVQGIGACVGPTLGRAIARDVFGPMGAAKALAYIAMIMALAPAIAPTVGGLMLEWWTWSAIFYLLALYSLISIIFVILKLPESLPIQQSLHPRRIAGNYLELLRHRRFMATTCASSLLYAGMVCFLSGSSFIFVDMMGVPTRYFGLLFLPTVAGYMAGNAFSTRLIHGNKPEQVMWLGARIGFTAAVLMWSANALAPAPASIIVPMALFSMSLGIMLPHAMAAALRPFPHMAGTASALMGFIQMGLSSVAGALVGALLIDSAAPMTYVIMATSGLSLLLIWRLLKTS
ncbi:Bcr/CflA family efflux MFS transporter [Halieaceae bacterium IMCC14734]|uniref:Bcr/CflA family efflux transporter n=1 Tax=Candidatus Litorirhabdus singularis TaxID=2518993 RepID=A0ABT3TD64_9GAMM|nr:multidrug effflux MFS transporter [Candidatus Litorirhabdus singularis]MCX2979924.1 Bcr/CflA family efflux MFS transporter [Candidatus Litorirhabdus singularis]